MIKKERGKKTIERGSSLLYTLQLTNDKQQMIIIVKTQIKSVTSPLMSE